MRARVLITGFGTSTVTGITALCDGEWHSRLCRWKAQEKIIPLRIDTIADDSDLEELYKTERRLLYVAYALQPEMNAEGFWNTVKKPLSDNPVSQALSGLDESQLPGSPSSRS